MDGDSEFAAGEAEGLVEPDVGGENLLSLSQGLGSGAFLSPMNDEFCQRTGESSEAASASNEKLQQAAKQ